MANSGQSKINEQTQAFIDAINQINRKTIRNKRIEKGTRKGEQLDTTPIAIATGAVRPDTLTNALNRIMIASDPEGWERLHEYDYEQDEFEDEGDFENETDFLKQNKSKRGHYDILETKSKNKSQNTKIQPEAQGEVDKSDDKSN